MELPQEEIFYAFTAPSSDNSSFKLHKFCFARASIFMSWTDVAQSFQKLVVYPWSKSFFKKTIKQ